jgi:hypothetical protein
MIAGPTGSGKSMFVRQFVPNIKHMMSDGGIYPSVGSAGVYPSVNGGGGANSSVSGFLGYLVEIPQ